MKAIIITQPGGPEVLQASERPVPVPKLSEVLIKVYAAGLNRLDIYQRQGKYPAPAGAPQDIPGLEVAGEISAIGNDVTRWQVGDKVCALLSGGGYAGYATAPEDHCLPIPANITFEQAASLPETWFTIWSNVFDRCRLQPGESLLVHGGSSGIGVAAIQIATALGNPIYVTAGTDEKCSFCLSLGATAAINYKTENFSELVNKHTGGKGVDVILDMIGAPYLADNIATLAEDGRLVYINTMLGKNAQIDLAMVMHKRLIITGSKLRSRDIAFKAAIAQNIEHHLWPLLSSGKIKPVVYKTFAAADAAEAHRLMESSEHLGKIVLRF
jgi:NADPH2:quinone reductase